MPRRLPEDSGRNFANRESHHAAQRQEGDALQYHKALAFPSRSGGVVFTGLFLVFVTHRIRRRWLGVEIAEHMKLFRKCT